jgi:hypothetical protein
MKIGNQDRPSWLYQQLLATTSILWQALQMSSLSCLFYGKASVDKTTGVTASNRALTLLQVIELRKTNTTVSEWKNFFTGI